MRVTLLAYGSRGDVQPYVALALALKAKGHLPRLAAPENFKGFVEGFGIEFAPLAGDTRAMLEKGGLTRLIWEGRNRAFFTQVRNDMEPFKERYWDDLLASCQGADIVVSSPVTEFITQSLAEAVGAKCALSFLAPQAPSSRFASFALPFSTLHFPFLNRLSHWAFERAWWGMSRDWVNQARGRWGLAPLSASPSPAFRSKGGLLLNAFSPLIFERPSDWPESFVLTGAWQLGEGAQAGASGDQDDPGFVQWLEDGPPPVFFGFGSMPVPDHEGFLEMAAEVCEDLGMRALIGAGWNDIATAACDLPDNLAIVEHADHAWLFPQCAAIVHHGGAGTTHAGLSAGVPNLVCPFFADQPFWGGRVEKLGVGVRLPFRDIRAGTLKASLLDVLDEQLQSRASALGAALRQERGAEAAVGALERLAGAGKSA
jgi:sterol 3beta-glucosyltransferase